MTDRNTRPGGGMPPTAGALRALRDAFAEMQLLPEIDHAHHDAMKQLGAVREAVERHPDGFWREKLRHAVDAARLGHRDVELLRFPAAECNDAGRAISNAEAGWPATLTGEAAELYAAWRDQFRPQGFTLEARVLEYPHGSIGPAALFLCWAEKKG